MKLIFSTLFFLLMPLVSFAKAGSIRDQILPILRGLDAVHTEGTGKETKMAASWTRPHFPTTLTVFIPEAPGTGKQIEFNIQSRSAAMFFQMRSLVDEVSQEVSAPESLALRPSVFPSSRHTEAGFVGNMKVRVPNTPAGRNFSAVFLKQFREISDSF
ncbi:MAG: hypothetical protein K2X47_16415 [Bdellovibrionales bacterium]|nr:hypothetical protein [Bdellovibrionales bacterium]